MSQVMCLGCKKEIDETAKTCPHCGRDAAGEEGSFFAYMHEEHKEGSPYARNFYYEPKEPVEIRLTVWLRMTVRAIQIPVIVLAIVMFYFLGVIAGIIATILGGLKIFLILDGEDESWLQVAACPSCGKIIGRWWRARLRHASGVGPRGFIPHSDGPCRNWCAECGQPFRDWNDYHKDRELRDAEGNRHE